MDKKKYQKPVQCETCGISLNSDHQAQQHYSGKSHIKMLRKMGKPIPEEHLNKIRAEGTGSNLQADVKKPSALGPWVPVKTNGNEPGSQGQPMGNPLNLDYNMGMPGGEQPHTYGEFKQKRLADIEARAYANANQAFGWGGHQGQGEQGYADPGYQGYVQDPVQQAVMANVQGTIPTGKNNKRHITCTVCKDTMLGETQYEAHIAGKKHAKRLKLMNSNAEMHIPPDAPEMASDYIAKSADNRYSCTLCNIMLNGPATIATHLAGEKHKRKLNPGSQPARKQKDPQQSGTSQNGSNMTSSENQTVVPPSDNNQNSAMTNIPQNDASETQSSDAVTSEGNAWHAGEVPGNRNGWLYCRICDVSVPTTTKLQMHTASSLHKIKVQEKRNE